jgi:hypothetical protein
MELLNDHISKKALKAMLNTSDYTKILSSYTKTLMDRKENQCVRKTNLNSSSSKVHVGNDIWEACIDKEIYPKLISNIAGNFGVIFNDTHKLAMQKSLKKSFDVFLEDMTCEGDHSGGGRDKIRQVQASFNTLVKKLKCMMFNYTKEYKEQNRNKDKSTDVLAK